MARSGKQVFYAGTVQGVGFRRRTELIAHGFAVAGYVRNLPDGRVEVVAEGEAAVVDAFLAEVGARLAAEIVATDEHAVAPQGHRGFAIRRD